MEHDPSSERPKGSGPGPVEPLTGALVKVIERLREPPLLFALGVLIVLAVVAAISVEALTFLWIPALLLTVVALAAWVLPRGSSRQPKSGAHVRIRARGVGSTGVVTGIEGLGDRVEGPRSVQMNVKDVQGRTTGISGAADSNDD
jgi:hypothetical protein